MATFDDLENEVKELRKTIHRLIAGGNVADNAARVEAIVSAEDEMLISPVVEVGASPVSEVLE